MKPSQLKQELKQRGISQLKVAQELNKSAAAVSLVLNGKSRSKLIEEHIAKLLGRDRFNIWEPTRSVEPRATESKRDRLFERLLAIVNSAPATHLETFSFEELSVGLNSLKEAPFVVQVHADGGSDVEQRVNQWLDTPNPVFSDQCPRAYLNGSEVERLFLEKIIGSIEQGTFS